MRAELRRDALKPGAEWCWLDGPPQFRRPGESLNALARALVAADHAPLCYQKWGCILRWEDRLPQQEDTDAARAIRRYELASWHRDRGGMKPGEEFGLPGHFVEQAPLTREDESADVAQVDQRNMRDAVCTLLDRAAAALDAIG